MSHFLQEIFDSPIRLTNEEKENPFQVVSDYFLDYHLSDMRQEFWQIVQICLTAPDEFFNDPGDRANLLIFYEKTEELIEAAFIMLKERRKK